MNYSINFYLFKAKGILKDSIQSEKNQLGPQSTVKKSVELFITMCVEKDDIIIIIF